MWVENDEGLRAGEVAFLREVTREGRTVLRISAAPCQTNRSREYRLRGFCGETNNVVVYAKGMVRVGRATGTGRALVRPLAGGELRAALEGGPYESLLEEDRRRLA